jgi:two-component system, NtrC family, sensor histidine kinase PilS
MVAPGRPGDDSSYPLLRIYSYYRFALSLLLLAMFFVFRHDPGDAPFLPLLYLGVAVPYAALNLGTLILVLQRPRHPRPRHYFAMLVLDIAALILITHASGGINSGFAILLMVTVAAAALFVPGQIATLVAAVASLAVLLDATYLVLTRDSEAGTLFSAGLLGILLFASSLSVQALASRLTRSQALAQEKAEEVIELQQLNQIIVQRMRTGILFIDGNDRVRLANLSAAELLGTGEHDIAAIDTGLPASVIEPLSAWRANARSAPAVVRLRDNGPLIQLAFTRIHGPSGDGTLIFAEDLSQVAQQAQQLKLASLGRLTASIAHEIRNPLGSISHAAQLLRESPELPAEDTRLVDIVIGNARRTNEVIESVLTLSRGQQPRPELLDLGPWLARFAEELRNSDDHNAVALSLEPQDAEIMVRVDTTHLRQVLTNLCENGLRYSKRETGSASIRLGVQLNTETGLARLDVSDQGKGIARENVINIFEPFFTTESSGTGLGLYLSRELCEANRIRLEYLNEPGTGSCFRLHFPHRDRLTPSHGTQQ